MMVWWCKFCEKEIPLELVWFFHKPTQQWRPVTDESLAEIQSPSFGHSEWDHGIRFPCGEVIRRE